MRKEVREQQRIVRESVYIAEDGKEFDNIADCRRYEESLNRKVGFDFIDKEYRIPELDDQIPIHSDASFSGFSTYRWYKVNNKEELTKIEEAYGEPVYDSDDLIFPTYICMETEDEHYNGQPYHYTLDETMRDTRAFFKNFGWKVEFKRED